jgi:acetyl-CoA carboxylase carboxyl transferase subunit alpha
LQGFTIVQLKLSRKATDVVLPFEKPLIELEEQIAAAETEEKRADLGKELDALRVTVFEGITPWERVLLARHPRRPRMREFVAQIFDDFVELHGDRALGDDSAMVTGIARFRGRTVFVVGQQKGVDTDEKVKCNFGMAHPEGYRKAHRVFRMAERLGHPIITLVDTPAAHPGIEAEAHGQGYAIAYNLLESFKINTPILSIILSEGGSGGALAIAVGDRIAMFENAVYVICPPERCAEILWRDVEKKELAASALRVSATDLKTLGVIDTILKEPNGGAHRDIEAAVQSMEEEIAVFLEQADKGAWNLKARQERFQRMGQWLENAPELAQDTSGEGDEPESAPAESVPADTEAAETTE